MAELQSSLSHLQSTLAKVKEQSAAIEQELNQVKRETNAETSEKERQRAMLEEQKKRDSGELVVLEEGLGIRIEGVDGKSTYLGIGVCRAGSVLAVWQSPAMIRAVGLFMARLWGIQTRRSYRDAGRRIQWYEMADEQKTSY